MYGYYAVVRTSYLSHHGILGMKWGIRRFQNYDGTLIKTKNGARNAQKRVAKIDKLAKKGIRSKELIEEHTIPVGTKIYRTTAQPTESQDGIKYISYADADRQHYNAGWIRDVGGTDSAFEHTYELTEDIKIPSRKEVSNVINDILDKDNKLQTETVKAWLDVTMPPGSESRFYATYDPDTGESDNSRWPAFVSKCATSFITNQDKDAKAFQAMQSLGLNSGLREKVIGELKSRGFNGMTDEASVGGRNGWGREGIDPVIVFDGKILKETSKREIGSAQEKSAYSTYYDVYKRNWTKAQIFDKKSEW